MPGKSEKLLEEPVKGSFRVKSKSDILGKGFTVKTLPHSEVRRASSALKATIARLNAKYAEKYSQAEQAAILFNK